MEIVRLISMGTSSIVTAHSTYLSGASVIFHLAAGIAVAADALAVRRFDVAVRDPFAAYVAAMRGVNLRALAAWADQQLFVGRRVQPVTFEYDSRLLKDCAAVQTDQHEASSAFSLRYYPQSQPRPSRKSLQGHLVSGVFSSLQGQ